MRAIVFRKYGKADVLEQAEVPDPSLSDDEVLVRVAAAGVNPLDWRLRNGELRPVIRLGLPFTAGTDVAGVVEAVGPSVASLRPGDRVFAMMSVKEEGVTPSGRRSRRPTRPGCRSRSRSSKGRPCRWRA